MRVELTYFTQSGKYYTSCSYSTEKIDVWEIHLEVQDMVSQRRLPGLVDGAHGFLVHVNVPDHPHNHPHLCLSGLASNSPPPEGS